MHTIKRYLSSIQNKKIDKFIKYEDINSDIDPLTESIDLGDIISEELYLAIPKYPKKKKSNWINFLILKKIPN